MAPRSSVPPVDSLSSPRPTGGLLFRQPEAPETSPSDLPSPSDETSPSDPLDASRSASEPPHDEPNAPSEGDPTSSRGSSTSRPAALSKRTLRDAVRRGVLMAGSVANGVLARDQASQQLGLYLADEDDAKAIGDPLAEIAHRRGGIGAAGNPDVADAIAALVGLALYGAKQFALFAEARMYRAQLAERGGVPEGAGEPADDQQPAPAGA